MPEHVLSLSYGKDSLACLGAIEQLGWPLDRIVHAEVWATDTIPADLPPMVEFKAKADKIILERWGIEVEHVRAKRSYEDLFYMVCHGEKSRIAGKIYGWPFQRGPWCNSIKRIAKNGHGAARRRRTDVKRLTTNDENHILASLNLFYCKDNEVWIRGGGPEPDYADCTLVDWIVSAAEKHHLDIFSRDAEGLGEEMYDFMQFGSDTIEGIVALLHAAAIQAAEMRGHLAAIEDILGDEYDLDRLRELAQADREGKIPKYTIGDTVYDRFGDVWEVTAVELHPCAQKNEWLYRCGHNGTDDYCALWHFEAFPNKEAARRRERRTPDGPKEADHRSRPHEGGDREYGVPWLRS